MAGLNSPFAGTVIPSAARGTGTVATGPLINAGEAEFVWVAVHVTAVSGSPTLDVALQTSPDNTTWTSVTGASITQMTAAGNTVICGLCANEYVQVLATVGGTATPMVTFAVAVVVM